MVSRRKILSRSRDDLNLDDDFKEVTQAHFQDDTWYSKEKLYKVGQHPLEPLIQKIIKYFSSQDHVEEILRKWDAIDDEIWAKVIVLERNRRVAKVMIKSDGLILTFCYSGLCSCSCLDSERRKRWL